MRHISRISIVLAAMFIASCSPQGTMVGLQPSSIPASGIYAPQQVVIVEHGSDYEFAAASTLTFTTEQVKEVTYCAVSLFAEKHGYSGWFERDAIETVTPVMREVNVIASFYRGEKPYFVRNKNTKDWCGQETVKSFISY